MSIAVIKFEVITRWWVFKGKKNHDQEVMFRFPNFLYLSCINMSEINVWSLSEKSLIYIFFCVCANHSATYGVTYSTELVLI